MDGVVQKIVIVCLIVIMRIITMVLALDVDILLLEVTIGIISPKVVLPIVNIVGAATQQPKDIRFQAILVQNVAIQNHMYHQILPAQVDAVNENKKNTR